MKHRPWTARHQAVRCPDAQLRWDRTYQSLVMWSCRQNAQPSDSEEQHENCPVCTGQKSVMATWDIRSQTSRLDEHDALVVATWIIHS